MASLKTINAESGKLSFHVANAVDWYVKLCEAAHAGHAPKPGVRTEGRREGGRRPPGLPTTSY